MQAGGIKNSADKSTAGSQLFRKYPSDFERRWVAIKATAAAAVVNVTDDEAVKAVNDTMKEMSKEEAAIPHREEGEARGSRPDQVHR